MTDPTAAEQLAAARDRIRDLELERARLAIETELADATARAAQAEARAAYAERRLDELEQALGRRRRAAHDLARGIERLRDTPGYDH